MHPYTAVFSLTGQRKRTCQQCYQRKVRCNGDSPCHHCQRLGFRCSFEGTPATTDSRPERLRGSKSCSECRGQKTRCSNTRPRCTSCVRRGWPCNYRTGRRTPTEQQQKIHPNMDKLETVKTYFDHLYPVPSFSFLHPPTTIQKCQDDTLDEALFLAIRATVSTRFNNDNNQPSSDICKAEDIIWKELEHPSISRLQALLLIISHRVETGGFQKAFMLAGLAARAASAMRLNYERTDVTAVAAETRRRTVWCFKLIESYFSIGLSEFELCPFETIYLQPPAVEDYFVSTYTEKNTEQGTLSFCVRLAMIRRDIMKLTRELAVCDRPVVQISKMIRSLEHELFEIHKHMPYSLESPINILPLISTRWISRHAMMITSWHQCFCDLYRLLLPGYPEAPPQIVLDTIDADHMQQAGSVCKEHATAIIDLLCNINELCTTAVPLEFDTAICGYHATRLSLFLSSQSSSPDIDFSISRASVCLTAMKRFFQSSALAKPILEDMQQLIENTSAPTVPIPSVPRLNDPPISSPAKVRQRLAIHSLLRQADFSDEDGVSPQ